jgi:hypothetical protein
MRALVVTSILLVSARAHADEIAARLFEHNPPTGGGSERWSISLGAGAERTQSQPRHAIGELAIDGGVTVDGPHCALFDTAARLAVTDAGDASATAGAAACLQGFHPDAEDGMPDPEDFYIAATSAYAHASWNERPPLDDIALLDGSRFTSARAGVITEAVRYFATPHWSLAGGWAEVSQSYLRQRIDDDDVKSATQLDVALWLFEARYHRPPSALTDTAIQLLAGDVTETNGPYKVGTIGFTPGSVLGLGVGGLYLDATYGWRATSGQSDEEPSVWGAVYRLALRLGDARVNTQAVMRRRLRPALAGAVVIEERRGAELAAVLGRLHATAEAYRAHDTIYRDRDSRPDREVDVWGIDGALSLQVWRGWTLGTRVEVGRSFAFADPAMDPAFGFRALGSLGYRHIARAGDGLSP